MSGKKIILALAALALAASGSAQSTRLTDDRELFIGVGSNSLIAPNVMILMDNSGSMETAIYHPFYNPNVNYRVDASGHDLTLNNIDSFFTTSRFGDSYRTLRDSITFNVCRGEPHYVFTYDKRGRFGGRLKRNPRVWKVYRDTGAFAVGDVIDYNGDGSGVNDKTRVIAVSSLKHDTGGYYWEVTVDTNYDGWANDADSGSWVYVNYRQEVEYTDTSVASLAAAGSTCDGADASLQNVKLYGTTDTHLAEGVMYDVNYLYWLCFHATAQQVAEVTYWATSGNYTNPATGVVEYAGYYRLAVTKSVLTTVAAEVYQQVRLGLARFKYDDDSGTGGGMVMDVMQNNGNLNEFQTKINLIKTQNLGTPLAETMADIWYYFKGGLGN